jgi:sugar lactone lactonase YvrE
MRKNFTRALLLVYAVLSVCVSFGQTITLTGNNCVGTTLQASFTGPVPDMLVWKKGSLTVQTTNPDYVGTVVAGGNGNGAAANQLGAPRGLFVDASGNIYVADAANHRIQKWTPGATTGVTVAGGNGAGSAANQINGAYKCYVDASGNIYIADYNNHRVQKWAAGATSGVTVAGGNGPGSGANQFSSPRDLSVDAAGNIYIVDAFNHRIQKWAPGATSGTTVAGTGISGSTADKLNQPSGLYLDASGNMYISDFGNNRIQKWTAGASSGTTVAGGNGFGNATNQIVFPMDVDVDASGNMYIADQGNNRIQKWASGATAGVTVGGGNGNGSFLTQLNSPFSVQADAAGNTYVCDLGNFRVLFFSTVKTIASPTPFIAASAGIYTVTSVIAGAQLTSTAVTVDHQSTATITGTITVCANAPSPNLTFTGSGGISPYTFTYTANGVVQSISSVSGNIATYAAPTNIGTVMYALMSVTDAACTTPITGTATITVNAKPTVNAITGTLQICGTGTGTTQLGNTTPAGVWSSSNTSVATINSTGLVTALQQGSTLISYTVTNVSGCVNASTATVTVGTTPAITPITGLTVVCRGSLVSLTSTTPGGTWTSGNTSIAVVNTLGRVTGVSPGIATITYRITNASGCFSTTTADVTINALPVVSAITGGGVTICAGSTVQLNNTTPGGVWSTNAAASINSSGLVTGQIAGVSTIIYRVTNASGCSAADADTVNVITGKPAITLSGSTTLCSGSSVTLTANPALSYLWSNGSVSNSITVNTAGNYYVSATNANGCTGQSEVVVVSSSPAATLSVTGDPYSYGNLSVQSSSVPAEIRWYKNNVLVKTSAQSWLPVGTVVAGGSLSGTGLSQLNGYGGLAIDASNNLYITDAGNHRILKWVPGASSGVVVAGGNGPGIAANQLNRPVDVAVDASGNVYVADEGNARVQKWTPGAANGITVAGGYGFGTTLNVFDPWGIYVDAAGSIYVTDDGASRVLKFGSSSYGTVVAGGNGAGSAANQVGYPNGLYGDKSGNIYIADMTVTSPVAGRVQKWAPGATTGVTVAGGNGFGNAANQLKFLYDIFVDNLGNVFVSDLGNGRIQKWAPGATEGVTAAVSIAWGAVLDKEGNLYTSENTAIKKFAQTIDATFPANADGIYKAVVITQDGCSYETQEFAVNVNQVQATITASGPTQFCEGGSVVLTANTGNLYVWSNGATTQSISVTQSGSYTVSVTDGNGFSSTSAPATVTVDELMIATITALGPTQFCVGGSVVLTANNGDSYLWSTGAITQSITVTQPGNYIVSVANSSACTSTYTTYSSPVTVTVVEVPEATITASGPLQFCSGGSVVLTANHGEAYLWSNGATTQSISVTTSGTYVVSVVNANACTSTSYATSPPVSVLVDEIAAATITASGPTQICAGGSVILTASPGTLYAWSNGATTQSITVTGSGIYTVTVVSSNNCSSTAVSTSAPLSVTVDELPAVTISASGPTQFCPGGTIILTASNSDSYLWNTGAVTQSITVTQSGLYTVNVVQAEGCSITATANAASISVTIDPLPVAYIIPSGPTQLCVGGSVILTAGSGDAYLWSNGEITQSITVTQPGVYTVSVITTMACSSTSSFTATSTSPPITVTVDALPAATILTTGPIQLCPGGSVLLTAGNGQAYLWSSGETTQSVLITQPGAYTVSVVNANGCTSTSAAVSVAVPTSAATITASGPTQFCSGGSVVLTASNGDSWLWSTGAITQSITVTQPGIYTVNIVSTLACSPTSSFTSTSSSGPVTVTVNPLPAATITVSGAIQFCAGGSVVLTAAGGELYLWNNGETTQSVAITQTGSYTVTVVNANGCTSTASPVTVTVDPLPVASITTLGPTQICAGGSVTLTTGSNELYLWSNGETTQSVVITQTGSYTVSVVNANGCTSTASGPVTVTVDPLSVATITALGPTNFCTGGAVVLTASSGNSYLWSNGSTMQSILVTQSGNYSVTVTNGSTCPAISAATTVTVNPWPVAGITTSGPARFCAGGSVVLTASNGDSWLWSNGAVTQSITVTQSGIYTVDVVTTTLCAPLTATSTSAPVTITVDPLPAGTITASGPLQFCSGGSVILTAGAGDLYFWSDGQTTQSVAITQTGSYTVSVVSAAGCSSTSAPVTVTVDPVPVATITALGPVQFCSGGSVILTTGGGELYFWSNGETTQSIAIAQTGSYTVSIVNANGCTSTASIPVTVTVDTPAVPMITASGPINICIGGSVVLTASGGNGYAWSNGATTQSITVTHAGDYTVSVVNANGCSATSAVTTITVDPVPPATITASGPIQFCAGGSVVLTASAGDLYIWSNGATTQAISVTQAGNYSVTVTNASGCQAVSTPVTVTVPVLAPATITMSNIATCSVRLTANAGTGITYQWSLNGALIPGATTSVYTARSSGSYTVTESASECSVTSVATSVTLSDVTSPVAKTKNIIVNLNATGTIMITTAQVNNASTDNCTIAGLQLDKTVFDCSNVGNNTVTLTVTDGAGNTSSATAVVTVQDLVKPVVLTKNISIPLDASGNASITASQVNNGSSDNCGIASVSVSPSAFTCANLGSNTVILTVTDVNGNTATRTAVVTVQDLIAPVVITKNITVQLGATGTAVITAALVNDGSTDNCTIASMTVSPLSFNCTKVGANTVILTVKDSKGNTATGTAVVTVTDATPPTVHTKNITVNLNSTGTATITTAQVNSASTDNCGITSFTLDKTTFDCSNIGDNIVTLTATDAAGNTSSEPATVTIRDITKPIVVTKTATVQLDANGTASVTAAEVNNGSTDNCAIASMTVLPSSFTCANSGNSTVTLTVTDASGNTATKTAVVVVQDLVPPTALAQDLTVALNAAGTATITAAQINNGSTDNCAVTIITVSPSSFNCSNVGANTVTLTVKDAKGNTSFATATVTVTDVVPPVVITKNISVALNNTGTVTITPAQVNNGSTDRCGILTMALDRTVFSCSDIGPNTVTLTIIDVHGNVSSGTATVTVTGEIPSITISSIPTSTVYTGGIATNLYLGYGATGTGLKVIAPASGAPYTYQWSGTGTLSNYTSSAPVFSPNAAGSYSFTVVAKNKFGCTTTSSITICVTDIRVVGVAGKVYVCNGGITQMMNTSAVAAYLSSNPTARLGSCDQTICLGPVINATTKPLNVVVEEKKEVQTAVEELKVTVMPNPSTTYFTLKLESRYETPVTMRVMDSRGRVVDAKSKIGANSTIQIGHNYAGGIYYAELIQGAQRKVVQLMKGKG